MSASDGVLFEGRCRGFAPLVGEGVEGQRRHRKRVGVRFEREFSDAGEFAGDGDFVNGILGERHADGVADSVREQAANADGAFDPSVVAVSCFGDAEVEWIVPVVAELVEARCEQAVCADHDLWITGFHGEHEVVEAFVASNPSKLEGAFHHAFGGIAVPVHDSVGQRAVVGADAKGDSAFFALANEWDEALANAIEFQSVLSVGVFTDVELLFVSVVTGVNANFFDPLRRFCSGFRFEMNIRNEGHGDAEVAEP
ncbi:MAG: hypothetical protein RIS92_2730 [Verrucomicrobiota bacterium]